MAIPSGVVTFLFTDVEGSTRLWEDDATGMAASLALHDRVMREAVAARGGHVFSTAGDAFAVAFASPDDGLAAALDVQLGLLAATWPGPEIRIRIGVHTGTADERDGDYFGPTLNRAARLMSAGHGGQVLVSSTMAALVQGGIELADLGSHLLKDLGEPEQVFELRHPDLPQVTAPLRTVDIRRDNLPEYLTTFVGRVAQLDQLADFMADHRLTVLTGVGGTGKTRLAVEAARRQLPHLPDGAWLVELAPVTDPARIMTAIGDIWELRPGEGATIEDVVARFLRSKELLVVVDNCEHLLEGAARAVRVLLDAGPGVKVLATSRESLGIPGEAGLRVPSLGLPDDDHRGDAEAVLLFADRAAAVGHAWDDAEFDDVARICARIDGIPLGLELAAARLRSLSVRELADRLDDSFRILSGSAKTALPRQRTLHATIDWSHDLLTPGERAVYRRASMFAGGFDLGAAEAVVAGGDVEEWEVLDHLDSLIDKSLMAAIPHPTAVTRYRMLEPVRQHAQEQLQRSGESAGVLAAHAHHYAGFVAEAAPHTRGPDQMAWDRRIDADYDNVRVAFRSFLEAGDLDHHLDMAFDLFAYWNHTGMQVEGVETTLAGLEAAPDDTDPTRVVKAWWTASALGSEITKPESVGHALAGLEVAESTGDQNLVGRMNLQLGAAIRHATVDPAYLEPLLEGRRLLEAHPEPRWWEPDWEDAFHQLLYAAYLPDEDPRMREHTEAAIAAYERLGDAAMLGATLASSLGMLAEDPEGVRSNVRRAIAIFDEVHVPYWRGHALQVEGMLAILDGDHRGALEPLGEAVALLQDCGDLACWGTSTRGLALAEATLGMSAPAAARLLQVVDVHTRLPLPEVAHPRLLDATARVLAASGRPREAALVLGCAEAHLLPPSYVLVNREALHASLREEVAQELGEDETDRLRAEGAGLDPTACLLRVRPGLAG